MSLLTYNIRLRQEPTAKVFTDGSFTEEYPRESKKGGDHVTQPQAAAHISNGAIRAVIGKVRGEGELRFAVAYLEKGATLPGIGKGESITFSLSDWQGEQEPRKEQVVLLEGVQLFTKGWRATSARPIILEPQATRKEQS